ncbi:hypothetical protein AB0D74_45725 [Streptomyces sp. NPDC048278]|uniref:hypothetical protein n=1 Tax=Streptomyces sp. NPDC048278 TaxID=3155809 RepID=UPI003413C81B
MLADGLAGILVLDVKRRKPEPRDCAPGVSAAFQHEDLGFALDVAWTSAAAVPTTRPSANSSA